MSRTSLWLYFSQLDGSFEYWCGYYE